MTQRAATMRIGNVLPKSGPVAQLGARFHGMEEVTGSIPVRSTKTSFSNTMQCKSQRTGWLFLCASFRPGSTVTRGAKQFGSVGSRSTGWIAKVAERQGFEPWIPCGIHAFQACALSHSAISPLSANLYESTTASRGDVMIQVAESFSGTMQCLITDIMYSETSELRRVLYCHANALSPCSCAEPRRL